MVSFVFNPDQNQKRTQTAGGRNRKIPGKSVALKLQRTAVE
jgi:hypothetical protein